MCFSIVERIAKEEREKKVKKDRISVFKLLYWNRSKYNNVFECVCVCV